MLKKKISILIFIWSALIFLLNLHYNLLDEYDIAIFWLSILLMFGIVLYQIFFIENKNFVIFEIFTIYFLLHLVYQIGYYGLRGSDSYIDYNFFKSILDNNNFTLGEGVTGWPILHTLSSIISLISKINPLIIAKFLPSFITSIIVFPIYLLVKHIYRDKNVALISCLLFSTIPQFISFEAVFVRETYAIFIFILLFYIIFVSKKRNDPRFSFMSIILIPVLVFGHHFTSFMFIIFLSIYLVASKTVPYLYRKDVNIKLNRINTEIILLIIIVAVLAYWIYLAVFILEDFFTIFYEATGAKELITYAERVSLGSSIKTLKGNIIYYGFFFFQGILSLILLIKLITKKIKQKIEDVTFTVFLYFSLFYGFLSLYAMGSILFPDRFLPFGWMVGVIPLSAYILHLKKDKLKKILIILLISFVVFNIYNINSEYITGNAPVEGAVATEKEYLIANQMNFSEEYYGYIGLFGAIYDIQGIDFRLGVGKNPLKLVDFHNTSDMVTINEDLYLNNLRNIKDTTSTLYIRIIETLSYKNNEDIDKICDLGSIHILKGGR